MSNTNDIIDIDLSVTRKKRFRFDKDDNRVIELNVSDMNILQRIHEAYPKLQEEESKASKLMDGIEADDDTDAIDELKTIAERLKDIDDSMRNLVDFIFDGPVSKAAAPDGSMYDPFEGSFRYEHIILKLLGLYENNMSTEFRKMREGVSKHTAKYTKAKRKR